ncbi:MAG: methylenetetrahydrofolate reductase [Oscillospiraceae bacterium]|nr:methylenetetrahydrofolate reductase [Oscillospiraceae bacterium]
MRITEIYRKGAVPISFEIFPPKGELAESDVRSVLTSLADTKPAYISVTCSAGGSSGSENKTSELCRITEREFGIASAAHITCVNSTRAEVDAAAESIRSAGITNMLALRGDRREGCATTDFRFGAEIIEYLRSDQRNDGICIGAGCYPEGHVECLDLDEDIAHLREKQDAGAEFLISQLFFSNSSFYDFIEKARAKGVTLPVDAGIMPIMGKSQVTRMIFLCGASLPSDVVKMLYKYESDPESLIRASLERTVRQIDELIASGAADGIHLYTMNKPSVAKYIMENVNGRI